MSEARLSVEITLPLATRPAKTTPGAVDACGNRLLLRTLNAMESAQMESHPDRLHERLEAKLDLALHWLGQALHDSAPIPEACPVRLDADGLAWRATSPAEADGRFTVILYPSPLLAAPLDLEVMSMSVEDGWLYARMLDTDEEWRDEWTQWLFRLHRRVIQASKR